MKLRRPMGEPSAVYQLPVDLSKLLSNSSKYVRHHHYSRHKQDEAFLTPTATIIFRRIHGYRHGPPPHRNDGEYNTTVINCHDGISTHIAQSYRCHLTSTASASTSAAAAAQ